MKIPKSAVVSGYKVLTRTRKSIMNPLARVASRNHIIKDTGYTLQYPKRRVIESTLCECSDICCKGIHFYTSCPRAMTFASSFLESLIVRCYVPKGGKYIKRGSKYRSNKLVCL